MINRTQLIAAFVNLGDSFRADNEKLNAAINRTYYENNWLTEESYWQALLHWKSTLTTANLENFIAPYKIAKTPKNIGVIMAGNIPMVGFHDLLCTLLSGHIAIVKPSSDDKYVMLYIINYLSAIKGLQDRVQVVERLEGLDGVIATGSNNSFRYFEHYFKNIPHLLRKNRKSMAVLSGQETSEELELLANDVFKHYGLGCRNVSFIYLPKSMNITRILDHFMGYKHLENHNKYANNYTYHRAILLMNGEQHLDTGFILPKERLDLLAPLACINYAYYQSKEDVKRFIEKNTEEIQCVVGNYSELDTIPYGKSQEPDLQDFADNINTLKFLSQW
jgi:hypothetical protein